MPKPGGIIKTLRRHAAFLMAASVVLSAALLGLVQPLDHGLQSARFATVRRDPSHQLTVVEIDAASLAALPQWPWPRSEYARAIANLQSAGATVIGFDVDFNAVSSEDQDRSLAAVIDATPGAVALPAFVQRGGEYQNRPLPGLARNALVASVNVEIDSDGRVRRYAFGRTQGERYEQSMASLLAGARYGSNASFYIDYGIRVGGIDRLSFADVANNRFNPTLVRGRAILVGASALELGDEFATPQTASMPGVYVHALAFESIVQRRTLSAFNPWLIAVIGLISLCVLWPRAVRSKRNALIVHCAGVLLAIVAPFVLQTIWPMSADFGIVLIAQALAIWRTIHLELQRRADELVRQRELHLREAALQDPETLLPNRRALLEELARLAREKSHDRLVCVAIGIEQFTALRAAVGYAKANDVIRSLARLIEERTGAGHVHHLSTSVLGIAASGSDDDINFLIDDLGIDLDAELAVGEHAITVSLRAGVASAYDGANADLLLERAVVALDYARNTRRRLLRYSENFPDPKKFLALLSDMAGGVARGEFHLVYQPKTTAREGDIVGAEALMRWNHPLDGPLSPDLFIGMAEETGAIDALTLWALRQAIADQKVMGEAGIHFPISVNVSGRTLGDPVFCDAAITLIQESCANICIEITETAVIQNPDGAVETIAALKAAGVRVSIDDYGVGLSSLSYLKRIAADELKIDKSLVSDLTTMARDRLIVKSTIDLAHALGMTVIAEGVESEATRLILASMGCDCLQGYLVGRPAPLRDFIARFESDQALLAAAAN